MGLLLVQDVETGQIASITCDYGATLRDLELKFGVLIDADHTLEPNCTLINQEINWGYDHQGMMLGWFKPVDVI